MKVSENFFLNSSIKCEEYDCPHILDDGNCVYSLGNKPIDCLQELNEDETIYFERIQTKEEYW